MQVPIVENVLKLNDEVAQMNRQTLTRAGVFTIDLIGSPGCGKTALLETTLRRLVGQMEVGVVVGDLATARDAERIAKWTDHVVQINTGKGCHLDANQVKQAISQLDLLHLDALVIENVGNLICPVGFDLGQDLKVGMFSVSEGDDKAAKHPYLVREAQLLLLNKTDLLPYVPFDVDKFHEDVTRINPDVGVMEISVLKDNIDSWINWLGAKVAQTKEHQPTVAT